MPDLPDDPKLDPIPEATLGTDAIKPRRRAPKPLVEGINAPAAGSSPSADALSPILKSTAPQPVQTPPPAPAVNLTDSEKALIRETFPAAPAAPAAVVKFADTNKQAPLPKILLPAKKSKKPVWTTLIVLLIICAGLGAYFWHKNNPRMTSLLSSAGLFPKPPQVAVSNQPDINTVPVASSSPVPSPVATATPPVLPPVQQLQVTATPTGYLNVRNQPSLSGKIISRVHPGEVYQYSDKQGDWYNITISSGTGWVNAKYVQVVK
ncbi:MAG: SH3 domain-containing protein [Patescibacteria group bacterium]|nr:SH3 domain-containing protein [Patescibacteria group bacterium]